MSDFWTTNTFEPKRGFRFLVLWNVMNQDLQFVAKSVDRPSYTVSSNPHKFFNHTFHYPGRVEWNSVTFTLVDAVTPNGAKVFMDYLSAIGYANPSDGATLEDITGKTISKATATEAAKGLTILEKGTGDNSNTSIDIGHWKLDNAFITEVNFGSHSYDSEEMIDITITVQYDWAAYSEGSPNT
jgi:hypothetical protein